MNQPTFVETINNIYTHTSRKSFHRKSFHGKRRGRDSRDSFARFVFRFLGQGGVKTDYFNPIDDPIPEPEKVRGTRFRKGKGRGYLSWESRASFRRVLHVASNITRLYGILKASRSARRESSSCSSERITRVARQTSLHDSLIVYDIIFNNKRRRYLEGEIIRYTLEKEIIQKSKGFEIRMVFPRGENEGKGSRNRSVPISALAAGFLNVCVGRVEY